MRLSTLFSDLAVSGTLPPTEVTVSAVCDHTDEITPGCLFICKAGRRFSPLAHLDEIEARGAAALLLAKGEALPKKTTLPIFYAEDLARTEAAVLDRFYGYPTKKLRLFAVTGTNGKTSTALFLAHLFHASGIPCGYMGTLGATMGGAPIDSEHSTMTTPTPTLIYRRLSRFAALGAECVIMEVSSHALGEERIPLLHFECALFTNLSEDHLDYHGSMEQYFCAKASLFAMAERAIVNRDDAYGERLLANAPCPTESIAVVAEGGDYFVRDLYENGVHGTQYLCCAPFGEFPVAYPLFGAFNVYNTLLAIAAALRAGLCPEQIKQALLSLPTPKGRLERLPLDTGFSVIIDYAHTPDAMENALKAVRRCTRGRLVALFGAGGDREREKRPQMGKIACRLADTALITADNARSEAQAQIFSDILSGLGAEKNYLLIPDRKEAIRIGVSLLERDDTLLLLGKGHEEYMIEGGVTRHFSEREIVAEALKEKKTNDHST